MLPDDEWTTALAAAQNCDVFISIGTSGIVYPAAELPFAALANSATVVHINPVRFAISSEEYFIQGAATSSMKSLLEETFP
jgi:NAD-dependent deacetylase